MRPAARTIAVVLVVLLFAPGWAFASGAPDPVAPVLVGLAAVLLAAKLCGHVAVRAGQPAVLGELVAGIVLGNLHLAGVPFVREIGRDPTLDILARLGVVLLLFEVGLESTIREMLKVGVRSLLVALAGVAAPLGLGWLASRWLMPAADPLLHVFLGATLTATSVGITARVLQDLGASQRPEARVILGAAVIDDVLGLVILSVVSGCVTSAAGTGGLPAAAIGLLVAKALGFLVGALALGAVLSPPLFTRAASLEGEGVLIATALSFCFVLSYAASWAGLAPIVGAYAAGLILEPVHFRPFAERGEHGLKELVKPIGALLVPVFFVLMGMHVDVRTLARLDVLGLAGALTAAAVLGKLACAIPLPGGMARLAVGFGMVPRGEVGLIFAGVGRELTLAGRPLIDEATFSAITVMVLATTLITPPALKWAIPRDLPRP